MGKVNCLIQCGDHFDNKRRILSLAIHLKDNGYNPIVLVYNSKHDSHVFRAHRITTINYYEYRSQYKLPEQPDFDADFDDVYFVDKKKAPYRFNGANLAKRKEELDRDFLAIYSIIKNYNIEVLFVWNGFTGNIANLLRFIGHKIKLKSYFLERGFSKDSLFIDRLGANAASEFSQLTDEDLKAANANVTPIEIDRTNKNHALLHKHGLVGQKIIFVPLQVQTDTNNILYSDYIHLMRDLVLNVYKSMEFGRNLDDAVIVVREHPEETEKNLNLPKMKGVKYINDGGIDDWCDLSDLVININSTVGMQAILRGCPTISLGRSIYSNKGIDLPVNLDNLKQNINHVLSGQYEFPVEKVKLFYSAFISLTQCSTNNIPKCLIEDLGLTKKKYNYKLLSEPKAKKLLKKKNNNELINILVKIRRTDYLNLTYRKIEVELNEQLVRQGFLEPWNRKLRFLHDARINLSKIHDGDVDIVITDDFTDCNSYKSSIVFNKYMVPIK